MVAGEAGAVAEILAVAQAVAALPAGPGEPRDSNRIAGREALASRQRSPDDLVPEHEGELRLRQVAVDDVQVGPADAARLDGDDDLAGGGLGIVDLRLSQQ